MTDNMNPPKIANTSEELKKLFQKYPEIEPAFRWVERNQDLLTAPISLQEWKHDDNHDPFFVVHNNDDCDMLYSNLIVKHGYVVNLFLRGDEPQTGKLIGNDDRHHDGDSILDGGGDAETVHRCAYSKCKVPVGSMAPQMCHFCREKYMHQSCFLDNIAKTEYLQKFNIANLHPEHVFCGKKCLRKHYKKEKQANKANSDQHKQRRLWEADGTLDALLLWLTTEGDFAAYPRGRKANKKGKTRAEYHNEINAFIQAETGVVCGVKAVEDKIKDICRSYKHARDTLNSSGFGLNSPGSIEREIKKMCPYFYDLEPIMMDCRNVRPEYTSDDVLEAPHNDDPSMKDSEEDADATMSMGHAVSSNQEYVKLSKKEVAGALNSSSSSERNKSQTPELAATSMNNQDMFSLDDSSTEEMKTDDDVPVTKMVEGCQKNSSSGERIKSKEPKHVTATGKRSRTQKHLALPSAKQACCQRVTSESVMKSFLSDAAWKEEARARVARAKAQEMLIRAQAKQAEAQAKQAEAQAKHAEENRICELIRHRHDLLQQGISAEEVDALLPLPDAGQSSV